MRKAYKCSESKLLRDVEEDEITTYLEERNWEGAICIYVARDKFNRCFFVLTHNTTSYAIKGRQFVDQFCDY
jgi:hypothetical protein